jgi:hypothetical protein
MAARLQNAEAMRTRPFAIFLALLICGSSLQAASFVVPDDFDFFKRADAIVIAASLNSYTRLTDSGAIQTVTTFSIEGVINGAITDQTIDVIEPGGVFGTKATIIPGVPRFQDGNRYLLFLMQSAGEWHIRDLALGKFSFATDVTGRKILVRDEEEIAGWDPDGSVHLEPHRSATLFVSYLRQAAQGVVPVRNYPLPKDPIVPPNRLLPALSSVAPLSATLTPGINATFTPTSYTFILSGTFGGRWNVFPAPVAFFSVGTETGAPGNGTTAIANAFAAWNNDPNSNVNYTYAGQDVSGLHNGGAYSSDGQNTIAFEQDLSAHGIGAFTCTPTSYGGTLGVGGITNAAGTHTGPNGETFYTATEGDVQMNKGIANCTLLFNSGDFNSAVAHEVGHTLGFRHSDQTRADNPAVACTTDASLECADVAIMKSFIPTGLNGSLQPWDQHAVAALYPGSGVAAPPAPTGVNARATSATSVLITWNASTGATSYEVHRRAPGVSDVLLTTTTSTSYTDTTAAANTAYLYHVRAVNAGGSADSAPDLATTVIFVDDPLTGGMNIKAVHLSQLRIAVNAVRALAGLAAATFTDAATAGVPIKAVHINELRTNLDAAMGALGLTTGGWTDVLGPGVTIRAIHFQEIRNRVK